ncbi:MAG: tungsten cofactor oxidoreductase radical SAM maturase [Anaerolineales bacterium]|nr:tungsten cofactor oxidoreductase radical SAM maturase [Anaerolineales bacterium]
MMAKISLGNEGQIQLPEFYQNHHVLGAGNELILEASEHSLVLHFKRLDACRAYLELTTRCNLNCAMCIRQAWHDAQGDMNAETFQAVLDGLRAFPNLKRVVIGGFGEPLLHPKIVEMVTQIHSLGVGVTITTNGLLLGRSMAEALLKAGVDTLVVSLDSMHVRAYQERADSGGLGKVLENIQGVQDLIRDAGWRLPALGLEYVVMKSNLGELYKLPDIARQVGASFVIVTNLLPHTPQLAKEILYDRDEPLNLGGGWGVHRGGWIAWGHPKLPRMKWGAVRRCRFISEPSLVIGWDGDVSPCYALLHTCPYYIYGRRKEVTRYTLGSVKEQSLAEIWTSEEYVLFRAKVRDFRFPSCVDCGIDCTYAQENSDCWGNDPSCADCLWAQDILQCP